MNQGPFHLQRHYFVDYIVYKLIHIICVGSLCTINVDQPLKCYFNLWQAIQTWIYKILIYKQYEFRKKLSINDMFLPFSSSLQYFNFNTKILTQFFFSQQIFELEIQNLAQQLSNVARKNSAKNQNVVDYWRCLFYQFLVTISKEIVVSLRGQSRQCGSSFEQLRDKSQINLYTSFTSIYLALLN